MTNPTVSAVVQHINKAAKAQQAVQDAARATAAQIADERAAAATSGAPEDGQGRG